jgi:integrase
MSTTWLVLMSRSSRDSATTGLGNSGYQSAGRAVGGEDRGPAGAFGDQLVEVVGLGVGEGADAEVLPTPAVDALRQHLQTLPPGLPSASLFTRPDGSELRAHHVHYAWKFARGKAGRPDAHFHDLRHAGLTLSAQSGATLAEVMRRAGHSSAAAAMRYQHAADQRDAEIASRLSALAEERRDRSSGGD